MKFKVSSVKFTGNSGEGGWAQVHEFASVDVEKLKARGHLFAVFASTNFGEGVEGVVAGRELLTRLHEEYFGSTEQSAFNSVKNAVAKITSEFRSHWGNVEIAVVCLVDDVIYAATSGGASVQIFRNGMLAPILESRDETSVSASGYPQENDILILATSQFSQIVADGSIKAALKGGELGFAQELLSPAIRSDEASGQTAVAFMKFESKSTEGLDLIQSGPGNLAKEKPAASQSSVVGKMRLRNFVSKISEKLPSRRIYIRKEIQDVELQKNRKTAVSGGVILLVLLIVSIGFGMRQKAVKEQKESYVSKLESAKHEYTEALEISSLNPERARELFVSSRDKVFQLVDEEIDDPEIEELRANIEKGVEEILGEYSTDADLFLDLSLLAEGFKGDNLATTEETIFILDKASERIVSIAIGTKRSEVVAGPGQIDEPQNLAAYSGRTFIAKDDGVYEVGDDKKKLYDREWGVNFDIYAYAGNLYVLDKNAPNIIRFAGMEGEFSRGKSWLAEGQTLDLSDSRSWVIDGSVWVLTDSAQVLRFSLGNLIAFNVEGLFPELNSATSIYTNEELEYLYILDRERGRVVVLTKEGDYKAQYLTERMSEVIGISVSEKEKKLILLTGDKLYSVELKHL